MAQYVYQPEITTLNQQAALFLLASVAAHTTSVIPAANSDPDTGVQLTTGFGSTLSTAVGSVQVTTAESVCPVMLFGQAEISGASLSETKRKRILMKSKALKSNLRK